MDGCWHSDLLLLCYRSWVPNLSWELQHLQQRLLQVSVGLIWKLNLTISESLKKMSVLLVFYIISLQTYLTAVVCDPYKWNFMLQSQEFLQKEIKHLINRFNLFMGLWLTLASKMGIHLCNTVYLYICFSTAYIFLELYLFFFQGLFLLVFTEQCHQHCSRLCHFLCFGFHDLRTRSGYFWSSRIRQVLPQLSSTL